MWNRARNSVLNFDYRVGRSRSSSALPFFSILSDFKGSDDNKQIEIYVVFKQTSFIVPLSVDILIKTEWKIANEQIYFV